MVHYSLRDCTVGPGRQFRASPRRHFQLSMCFSYNSPGSFSVAPKLYTVSLKKSNTLEIRVPYVSFPCFQRVTFADDGSTLQIIYEPHRKSGRFQISKKKLRVRTINPVPYESTLTIIVGYLDHIELHVLASSKTLGFLVISVSGY